MAFFLIVDFNSSMGLATSLSSAKHPNQIKILTRPTSVFSSTLSYSTYVHLVLSFGAMSAVSSAYNSLGNELLPKVLRIAGSAVFIGSSST